MLRWIKIGETKKLQEGVRLRTIAGSEYTEWRDVDIVEADTTFRSGCIGPLSNVEVMAEIGRLTADNERLRAALRQCLGMVGHPDNIAFIEGAINGDQQQPPQAWVEAKKEVDDGWPDK